MERELVVFLRLAILTLKTHQAEWHRVTCHDEVGTSRRTQGMEYRGVGQSTA